MIRIESRDNPAAKHFSRLSREKKYRVATGQMVCEGHKLLMEALASHKKVGAVMVRQGEELTETVLLAESLGAKLYEISPRLARELSDVETPQGVLFTCDRPIVKTEMLSDIRSAVLLLGMQDPGNMGTVLRTADAFSLDAVILCEGCTDPTAPKVVRATMGAIFRQAVYQMKLEGAINALHAIGVPVYAAALGRESVPVSEVSLLPGAVVIGNEGNGIPMHQLELCDRSVILPMAGHAESLNAGVAASIFIWEMSRKGG